MHLAEEETGLAVVGFLIGVGEKVPLTIELVGGTMANTIVVGIGTDEGVTTTFFHWQPPAVEVRTCHFFAATNDGAIGAALASTAIVETDEEVVVLAVMDDEGCLDCIFSCFDGVVALNGVVGDVVYLREGNFATNASGNGLGLAIEGLEVFLETDNLDAVPEGTEGEPGSAFVVDDEVGIDAVVGIFVLMGHDDWTLIFPLEVGGVGVEGLVGGEADGRAVLAKGGAGIVEVPVVAVSVDVGCPGVSVIASDGIACPLWNGGEDGVSKLPCLHVGGGEGGDAHACAKDVVASVFASCHDGVMYVGMFGIKSADKLGTDRLNLLGKCAECERRE